MAGKDGIIILMVLRRKFLFFLYASFIVLCSFAPTAYADTLGQKVSFNVNSHFDKYSRTTLGATLRHVGEKAYLYVDDSYWNSLDSARQGIFIANAKELGVYFDNIIYPRETEFFGSEPNPGVDSDPRVTILFEELIKNNGGYFDTVNGYAVSEVSDSNAREMVALNAEILYLDLSAVKIFLAHEFQHLISFNQKEKTYNLSEDVWLNELRSEYAVSRVGLNDSYENSNLNRRVNLFSNNTNDSLTEWKNENTDYAMVALFAEYLVEQFGSSILSDTIRTPLTGIAALNNYLVGKGYYEKFEDIFLNWLGALYINDVSKNPKLGYGRPELRSIRAMPQQRVFLSPGFQEYSITHYLKDWQPLWVEFDVDGIASDLTKSFKIDLSGESGQQFVASYLAVYGDGSVGLGKINLDGGGGSAYILNSAEKRLQKVIVLATKKTKLSGFRERESVSSLGVQISTLNTKDVRASILKDGELIKRPVEKETYVIWGKYKRYLNPGVISLYGHLNTTNAIELAPTAFDSYQSSNYVKYVNDEKVYAIWPDGTKHWLNITPHQWDASGRDWNAIFTINDLELNYYRTGADITR